MQVFLSSLSIKGFRFQSHANQGTKLFASSLLYQALYTIRPYTKGAEKLFHRVDWERAVGLVIVVDPFDPGSLLYLPPAHYTDLIKTAMANRSTLIVVHGLNDVVPTITVEADPADPKVQYRVFRVAKEAVHKVPITSSQNSPLPFLSPTTSLGKSGDESSSWSWSKVLFGPDPQPKQTEGAEPPKVEDTPPPKDEQVPKASPKDRVVSKGSGGKGKGPDASEGSQGKGESNEGFRSALGLAIEQFLRGRTSDLIGSGLTPRRPRRWVTFLDKRFMSSITDLKWVDEPITHRRRPLGSREAAREATLLHMFTWAGSTLLARSARSLQWSFAILGVYLQVWQSNGLKTANGHFHEARRVLMKFLSGEPVKSTSGPIPMALKNGLPSFLPRGLRRYILGGHVTAIRLTFFMLNVCDILKYETKPKVETITAPYNGIQYSSPELEQEIKDAVQDLIELAGSYPPRVSWKSYHVSVKGGPFASAMVSAPLDAVALGSSETYQPWVDLCRATPGADVLLRQTQWLEWATRALMKRFWSGFLGCLPVGRASQVIEPRGKIRVVAIPGYQVQSILKPLHNVLYKFLEKLPTDHTFNQDEGVKRAMASGMKNMRSFDLSAATDRFPLWFEENVLKHLLSKSVKDSANYSSIWSGLLQSLSFAFRYTPGGRLHWLRYGSGQPMGTYSSWASFAVAHHVVVMMAARRAGIARCVDYELLGDDIVLRGDSSSHSLWFDTYQNIMKDLGVGINPNKGVSSTLGCFEFAKRFVRGSEVLSSLRWKELASSTSWKGVFALLVGISRRGLPLPHLRVALEVGYVLIFKKEYQRDLTNPRRVNLLKLPTFKKVLVLLTSPIGPYKVPLVAWLSGQGTYLVDFHPNLGHFVNSIERVVMGHDIQYPLAIGLRALRAELVKRVLSVEPTAIKTISSLVKTICHIKEGFRWPSEGLSFTSPDPTKVSEGLRQLAVHTFDSLTDLFVAAGATARVMNLRVKGGMTIPTSDPLNPNVVDTNQLALGYRDLQLLQGRNFYDGASSDLLIGLARVIVSCSPAHLINVKGLRQLLDLAPVGAVEAFDPDGQWAFGHLPLESLATGANTQLEAWARDWVDTVVPAELPHPSQLHDRVGESITDFLKFSVADILPGALPKHLDLMESIQEVMAMMAFSAYKALRDDCTFSTKTIFTLPERTDQSKPPGYLLEYTNSVRLDTSDPDSIPRVGQAFISRRWLAMLPECTPTTVPEVGFESVFKRKIVVSNGPLQLLNTGLPDTPEVFSSLLCDDSPLFPK
jgi:hypothetical protein